MDPLLDPLNPPQREAVLHGEGPLLILAGAGSGKTRVITHRIAVLIQHQGVDPRRILAVTFTNKAAGEMRERVERLLELPIRNLWVSTFHSACVRILREHIHRLGRSAGGVMDYQRHFAIMDEHDRAALIRACVKELNINESQYHPRAIAARISALKNDLATPEQFAETAQSYGMEDRVARTYALYQDHLRRTHTLDFDDLLMLTVLLLEGEPQVAGQYQHRFQHILVDEYQDTNHAQYRLVRVLSARRRNLCVVGDDDQSIYRFRGADVGNILSFERDFPDAKVIALEQNYRSAQRILDAAWAVVARNASRKAKRLWTEKPEGDPLVCWLAADEHAEAAFACQTLQALVEEGKSLQEAVILYRTNAQSRVLEEALRQAGVPYRIVGGVRFYDRKEIKDLLAYLRVLVNPHDEISLKRIVNVPPRGIGAATLARAQVHARSLGEESGHAVSLLEGMKSLAESESVGSAPRQKLAGFVAMVERLRKASRVLRPSAVLARVMEDTGYLRALEQEQTLEARMRIENIRELFTAVEEFEEDHEGDRSAEGEKPTLAAYLDQVALVTALDQGDTQASAVTLMTVHNAKGLEFPVVILVGLEEGLFPHSRSLDEPAALEEERRLFYVALTRAQERVFLSHAESRHIYGSTQWNPPSRFLDEIPETHLVRLGSTPGRSTARHAVGFDSAIGNLQSPIRNRKPALRTSQLAPCSDSSTALGSALQIGARVRHPTFGEGIVQALEGSGDTLKLTVAFQEIGLKRLAARVAPLERVE